MYAENTQQQLAFHALFPWQLGAFYLRRLPEKRTENLKSFL